MRGGSGMNRRLRAVNAGPEAVEEFEEEQKKRRRRRRKRRHAVRAGKALQGWRSPGRPAQMLKTRCGPGAHRRSCTTVGCRRYSPRNHSIDDAGVQSHHFQDDLALFDVTSADVLRVGSIDGASYRIAKTHEWKHILPNDQIKFAFCPCDQNPMTHSAKRFYPLEPDPEAPPYLDDAYHSTLLLRCAARRSLLVASTTISLCSCEAGKKCSAGAFRPRKVEYRGTRDCP